MSEEISLNPKQQQQPIQKATEPKKHKEAIDTSGLSDADLVDTLINASTDVLLPWEDVQLPSKGLYYGWASGLIKVRPWNIKIDEIIATQRLNHSGQSLQKLFEFCCKFPDGFGPEDLLVGDQAFLLFYLRGITYGNIYKFAITAPSGSKMTASVDLNDLASTITYGDESLGEEPFPVRLPYASEKVGRDVTASVRFLRVKDVRAINKRRDMTKRALSSNNKARVNSKFDNEDQEEFIDDTLSKNLEHIITAINTVEDPIKIRQFVSRMHGRDNAVILDWLRVHTPSISTKITLDDPTTNVEFQVSLPLTETFLHPEIS